MGDFEKTLPVGIIDAAVRSGNELVIPLNDAKRAIHIASQNLIAILGIEAFRILVVGFGVETYGGYEFKFDDNWEGFVRLNNEAALRFIGENSFGQGYGYILTATSENEFRNFRLTV